MFSSSIVQVDIEREWIELLTSARELGITIEEIRQFFEECRRISEEKSNSV